MNTSFSLILYEISIWAIPAVIAITFHEASHGYVAHVLGDDTAWRLGRVSFNPLVHIDPFGTVVLPVMLLLLRAPFLLAMRSRCRSIFAHFAIRAWVRYWSQRPVQE
jgi:Zn-dependent protease